MSSKCCKGIMIWFIKFFLCNLVFSMEKNRNWNLCVLEGFFDWIIYELIERCVVIGWV